MVARREEYKDFSGSLEECGRGTGRTLCRPRQCSSATSWWKFPSVTFSVSSKDNRGFCVRGECYPSCSSGARAGPGSAHLSGPRPQPDGPAHSPPFSLESGCGGSAPLPTCAEGNWGTASRSRPCSWEWILARARCDRVSLCGKTEGGPGSGHPEPTLLPGTRDLQCRPQPALLHPAPLPTPKPVERGRRLPDCRGSNSSGCLKWEERGAMSPGP